ncbi:MAG TPA: PP0621 family protein [Usitatibacter sp.]|nr:PP0621 family protein [Usitatibacter sp.]
MGRILFFILIGIAIWLLWRGSVRVASRPAPGEARRPERGEDMVQCARCGVHLPRSEAREEGGRLVCRDNPRCHPAP